MGLKTLKNMGNLSILLCIFLSSLFFCLFSKTRTKKRTLKENVKFIPHISQHVWQPLFLKECQNIFWLIYINIYEVSTTEELLGRKSSGSSLENREYGRGDPPRWPRDTLYPQKLALTSAISGGRSVCIFRSRAENTELLVNSEVSSYSFKVNAILSLRF
jgi:hypothetical protein